MTTIFQLAAIADRFFNESINESTLHEASFTPSYPKTNIFMTVNKDLIIESAVPGFKKDEISVEIEGNILKIKGTQGGESDPKDEVDIYFSRQLAQRDFENEYTLSPRLDKDRTRVSVKDGLLRIVVPMKEEEKPKKLLVQIE